jgi:1,4-alpha-glucan branching enzyme
MHVKTTNPKTPIKNPLNAPTAPAAKSAGSREQPANVKAGQKNGPATQFSFSAPQAQSVAIAGSFNGWNPQRSPLRKNGSDWTTSIPLSSGRYEYRFVVDGKWISDPKAKESAPNDYGEQNSVLNIP